MVGKVLNDCIIYTYLTHRSKTMSLEFNSVSKYIAELKVAQQYAESIEEWNDIEAQIKELEMQYEDEDGKLQWL
jgi:hypothetical protein